MILEWKEEYNIGIDIINIQHIKLLEKANEFLEAIDRKEDINKITNILINFEDQLVQHFSQEETLQKKIDISKLNAHRFIHKKFIEDIKKFRKELLEKGVGYFSEEQIKHNFANWIKNHIVLEDKKYLCQVEV